MQHLRQGGQSGGFHGPSLFQCHGAFAIDRAASEKLHVSPSAISRQIAKLEHELRAPIFDRRAQGMKLTAAGEILLSKIDGVMREFSRVKSHIAALQDLQAGNVDVYCFQTAIESFVVPVLNRFHTQYPDVTFNIRMSSTDEAMEALVAGQAEIGLVLNAPVRDSITRLEVFRDGMVAAFSPRIRSRAGRPSACAISRDFRLP